ncbi:hypothetical protein PhaeoP48_01179 [Phaeobacter inhibens]|uniref:hypothetical protein n=1 Tax=Phaeobacter inhibens TaxID=221822 RepID=UPI000C9CBC80|nr:hypothetical protein [Phaeobacter inhibens]AUR11176.1 hypothetical protein PhaeoP48_01179 [Phaeobacter inhibens]
MTDLIKAADALAEAVTQWIECDSEVAVDGVISSLQHALTAYRTARKEQGGVKFKPLVWEETPDGYLSKCGYRIYANAGTRSRYALTDPYGSYIVSPQDARLRLNPYTGNELMDKAQAVHEARIKAALEDT